jgi:hypothetical protein
MASGGERLATSRKDVSLAVRVHKTKLVILFIAFSLYVGIEFREIHAGATGQASAGGRYESATMD